MLTDKTAVVTGGGRGIGRAVAVALAGHGANVAIIYAGNSAAAEETASECAGFGVKAAAYKCDVAQFDETKAVVREIISTFGGVDILVNNAGITRDGLMATMQERSFDEVIGVNLKGAFNMTKHLYANFLKRRAGRIINISSVVGLMGNAGQANYSASKAGLIGLTKATAKELGARGITCNAIAPGYIESDMTAGLPEAQLEAAKKMIPLARLGKPSDVAALAVFLASDAAAYITGEVIRTDGGLCM